MHYEVSGPINEDFSSVNCRYHSVQMCMPIYFTSNMRVNKRRTSGTDVAVTVVHQSVLSYQFTFMCTSETESDLKLEGVSG